VQHFSPFGRKILALKAIFIIAENLPTIWAQLKKSPKIHPSSMYESLTTYFLVKIFTFLAEELFWLANLTGRFFCPKNLRPVLKTLYLRSSCKLERSLT
jgi:hypothetical protein